MRLRMSRGCPGFSRCACVITAPTSQGGRSESGVRAEAEAGDGGETPLEAGKGQESVPPQSLRTGAQPADILV